MVNIRAALTKHLKLISSDIETSYEGVKYTPKSSIPYQDVDLLTGSSDTYGMGAIEVGSGIFQIGLYYPNHKGTFDIETKVKEIKAHFNRGAKLVFDGTCVEITQVPDIKNLGTIDDRIIRVVSIYYKSGE